jgi:hypothetical protein
VGPGDNQLQPAWLAGSLGGLGFQAGLIAGRNLVSVRLHCVRAPLIGPLGCPGWVSLGSITNAQLPQLHPKKKDKARRRIRAYTTSQNTKNLFSNQKKETKCFTLHNA